MERLSLMASLKIISIGLTGGIGCGKSTVAALLKEAGLLRLDTDKVARELVEPGTQGHQSLLKKFGSSIFYPDGTLDRGALGKIVFQDHKKRRLLESILHPLIWERVLRFQTRCEKVGHHNVVEVPLLLSLIHI